MPCGATQDRQVMVERSDRMWSTGEGNGKPLQYSCLENPMNSMKRQKDRILKDELPRSVGAQYATGENLFQGGKEVPGGRMARELKFQALSACFIVSSISLTKRRFKVKMIMDFRTA